MSLLGRLFGQSQKSINSSIFSFLNPSAGSQFREGDYLRAYKGWVYACVNAIAEAFSEIELTLQQKAKDGWQDVPDHPALDLLHKVNNFQSFLDLTYATQAYLELDGNAFWYLPRNGKGAPVEIWYMDPTKMQIVKSEQDFIGGYIFTNEKGTKIPFEVNEIIHFKRFNPWNKYRGIGTVQAAAISIDIDTYASEWQRNFFGNSAMPAGILSSEGSLSQDQYDRIKANWDAKYRGVQNAHKMAILEGGLKYTSLTPTSREMQFIEGRKAIRDEILGIFRVHPIIVSVTDNVNLANAEVGEYVFSKFTVKPKMRTFVSTLNEFYLPIFSLDSQKYRLHFKDPVPESIEQKRLDIESGIKNYYLTPNEARAQIGQEPIDGGDELYIPSNYIPLSQATTGPKNDTPDDGQDNADNGGKGNGKKALRVKKTIVAGASTLRSTEST